MTPSLAAGVTVLAILGLFALDSDGKTRPSWGLWPPISWLLISGSRHVSEWLGDAPVQSQQQYLQGSPIDAAVYGLILAAAIVVLLGRQRQVAKLLAKNWPIILFVLYCALSIFWSEFPGVAFKRWIKALGDYAVVLILLTEADSMAAIGWVMAKVSFVLLPASILLIKYYPSLGRAYASHWDATQFFVGVCDNKNMLGMVCMIFGFAAVCRLLQAWRGPRHGRVKTYIVHGAVAAMAVWLLILSNSKTSLSCFVLTCGLIAAHTFLKVARRRVVLHILVVTVVLSCFSVLFLGIGGGALHDIGRNSTLTGRTQIWAVLLNVPINPIVGTGFESFWLGERLARVWSYPIVDGITEAHNGYLEMYLNLGFVGLAFLAGLLWTGYRNILRLLDRDATSGRLRLGFFVIAVIYNFTEAGFRSTDLVWIAFLLAIFAPLERKPVQTLVRRLRLATIERVEYEAVV